MSDGWAEPNFEPNDVVPIAVFFGVDDKHGGITPNREVDYKDYFGDADLILGVNVMDNHEFLVYGRDVLMKIASGITPSALRVLRVGIDQETGELEKLIVLVRKFKGRDDYEGSE